MQTASGGVFEPFAPDPDSIDIEDIAHALSNICRYNGHTRIGVFYSVAQHSVLASRQCPPEFRLRGLLHDAAEAYLADIVRPVKPHLPEYQRLEQQIFDAVSVKFGIPRTVPEIVKDIDTRRQRAASPVPRIQIVLSPVSPPKNGRATQRAEIAARRIQLSLG